MCKIRRMHTHKIRHKYERVMYIFTSLAIRSIQFISINRQSATAITATVVLLLLVLVLLLLLVIRMCLYVRARSNDAWFFSFVFLLHFYIFLALYPWFLILCFAKFIFNFFFILYHCNFYLVFFQSLQPLCSPSPTRLLEAAPSRWWIVIRIRLFLVLFCTAESFFFSLCFLIWNSSCIRIPSRALCYCFSIHK